jgi:hypothetical protein
LNSNQDTQFFASVLPATSLRIKPGKNSHQTHASQVSMNEQKPAVPRDAFTIGGISNVTASDSITTSEANDTSLRAKLLQVREQIHKLVLEEGQITRAMREQGHHEECELNQSPDSSPS